MIDKLKLINKIGGTAFVIATIRAIESKKSNPLFQDSYADFFSNETAKKAAFQMHENFPPSTIMISFRTRYFDQLVIKAHDNGIRQIVLLGSGFDMRAHRFSHPKVKFFEIDQPGIIDYKSSILKGNGFSQPPSVKCNYLKINIIHELEKIGFDSTKSSLFIWEGNTMYLPPESVTPFLNQLSQEISSLTIAFDFFALELENRNLNHPEENELIQGIESALKVSFQNGFPDLSLFEKQTSFKISDSNSFFSLASKYGQQELVENYTKDWIRFLELYCYCLLKN
ncbi:MAG: SAM-dependent methyltransferase [Flavobacteriaceae bacterium]|nr:SAM-dependent methyltransferase [Flavobacteriaceae bacterium]MCY4267865.1 SAM-dependent methyltransferase [Flavobacteriaceae bacterium]MCY4299360.1 SAM-dependent methyltransferase [Flavobacteriaceae bacterium]